MRIGITGHTNLTDVGAEVIYSALVQHLHSYGDDGSGLIGVTCLADGADQLFARAVRDVGGVYEVVLPAPDYRRVVPAERRREFDALLAGARTVLSTGAKRSGRSAYVAANRIMLDRVDELIAVWDGHERGDPGGTADVVTLARDREMPMTVIWPAGAERT
ncbi:hypothetical protein [Dactylosporangium sp. NPDC049140]|jgi:hypothetical protein|uniref:hypothetical protein n=1 Tax=Dactylosporangium sp. NPDC049140 TaxID=3155647 RepID=UPI0033CF8629